MVHHTAPHIPFKTSDEWDAAQAQLGGTVHCNYPRWYVDLNHLFLSVVSIPVLVRFFMDLRQPEEHEVERNESSSQVFSTEEP